MKTWKTLKNGMILDWFCKKMIHLLNFCSSIFRNFSWWSKYVLNVLFHVCFYYINTSYWVKWMDILFLFQRDYFAPYLLQTYSSGQKMILQWSKKVFFRGKCEIHQLEQDMSKNILWFTCSNWALYLGKKLFKPNHTPIS